MTGQVTIVIAASDNVGVTDIDVSVDGAPLGSIMATPYQITWDTTADADGAHVLTATAHDAAGNAASATAMVTVANGAGGPGSGSDGETGSGGQGLPSCSAGASGGGAWPIGFAIIGIVVLRRRRRA